LRLGLWKILRRNPDLLDDPNRREPRVGPSSRDRMSSITVTTGRQSSFENEASE